MPTRGSYPPGFLTTGRDQRTPIAAVPPSTPQTERSKGERKQRRRIEHRPDRVLATSIVPTDAQLAHPVPMRVIDKKATCPCCEGLGYVAEADAEVVEQDGFEYSRKLV